MDRLDEMDFNQIKICYNSIFSLYINKTKFTKISKNIESIYDEYITYVDNKKYKAPSNMGRGALKYGRNIIWGWYIEDIIIMILNDNKNISTIKHNGGDATHKFLYNHSEKNIKIDGIKTVVPDFKIISKKNIEYCIELKTAAKEVFTIKKSNVNQLYNEPAINNRITIILMIDLKNKLFSVENLQYFSTLKPFPNARMEGQLCYNFPAPDKPLSDLKNEYFDHYLDNNIFNLDYIKKLKALNKAKISNNLRLKRIIKNKLSIERKLEDRDLNYEEETNKIKKIKEKIPEVETMSWNDIYKELDSSS